MPKDEPAVEVRTEELREALAAVDRRVEAACAAAGRDRREVTLVVVTKHFPAEDIVRLAGLGVADVGENRHQEAAPKVAQLSAPVRAQLTVHFIGQLQSNKAAAVAQYADLVHSVDRLKIAASLSRAAADRATALGVMLQVDLDQADPGRGGVAPAGLLELADRVASLPGLQLRGVMAVAPREQPPEPAFAELAELAEQVRERHPEASWISAGMSGDLESAVAHGATHLRVGSAILGSRPAPR